MFFLRDFSLILNSLGFGVSILIGFLFLTNTQGSTYLKRINATLFFIISIVIGNSILNFIGYLSAVSSLFELFSNSASIFFPVLIHLAFLYDQEKPTHHLWHLTIPTAFAFLLVFRSIWLQVGLSFLVIEGLSMFIIFNLYYLFYFFLDRVRILKKREGTFKVTKIISIGIYAIWTINIVIFLFIQDLEYQIQQIIRLNIAFLFSILSFGVLLHRIKNDGFALVKRSPFSKSETQKVIDSIKSEKYYRDSSLNIRKLANHLNVPYYKLSQALNNHTKQNFNTFINSLRVQEVVENISISDTKYSIWGLAQNAGFRSPATFYKAFKKEMGCNPTDLIH